MKARKLSHSPLGGLGTLLLVCALLGGITPPTAQATTVLTNGQPNHVSLPPGVQVGSQLDRTIVNGDRGFTVFVPPGAASLRVDFQMAPGTPVELLVQEDRDVGGPSFVRRADFKADPNGNGLATVVITPQGVQPPLKAGMYYIGFRLRTVGIMYSGTLTATINGDNVPPEVRIVESQFISDLEGWTRNDTTSPLPGTNLGAASTTLTFDDDGGNPGGFARLRHTRGFGPTEWFVAPEPFLLDFMSLDNPRFQFDLARIFGDTAHNFNVQMRVSGEGGAYQWTGLAPPETTTGFETFSATIDEQFWVLVTGEASFEEVFSNPKRIAVRANYVIFPGTTGLDNFQIRARGGGDAIPVLPTVTSFSAGLDGWGRNYPAPGFFPFASEGDRKSAILWVPFEGNPEGYVRIIDIDGGETDRFSLPDEYLGDMRGLNDPRFEFDYIHHSSVAKAASSPVEIRLVGREAVYAWTGVVPGDVWAHQIAPITPGAWTLVDGEGSFDSVLADVVQVEVSADHATGPEVNGIDNFALLTSDSPILPQTLTANPSGLDFGTFVTGGNPEAQVVRVSSSGGTLQWAAEAGGALADRVSFSVDEGGTPALTFVAVDSQGLSAGNYTGTITFTPVGTNISTSDIALSLNVGPQRIPNPIINEGGVVSSATYAPTLAPGSLGAVFGFLLGGPEDGINPSFGGRRGDQLPNVVDGVKVLALDAFGNVIAECPLLYLSSHQINFQLPYDVFGQSAVWIVVENNGIRSEPQQIAVQSSAPGIFKMDTGYAVAQNQNGSLNTDGNPLGDDQVLTVYFTGPGVVAPAWASGRAAPAFPPVRAPSPTTVTIGGVPATIQFIGLAPNMVGVGQLNVYKGDGTPSGKQTLLITINGFTSNPADVAIQ